MALEERAVQAFLRGRPRVEVVEAGSPLFARSVREELVYFNRLL